MIVGIAGHTDHGKTALIGKLIGVDSTWLNERSTSTDVGFAFRPRSSGQVIAFADVPGHEALVRNMLAGLTGVEFVVLVVAANEGVMPQTREHLAIVDLLGLERCIVALSKSDIADAGRIAEVTTDIERVLAETGLEGSQILPVSAVTGAGIDALSARLDEALSHVTARAKAGRFRLAVDRSFTLTGLGTAVTGTVLSGGVSVGERVLVSPSGIEARVRSIHAQDRRVERGEAGQRCALALSGPRVSSEVIGRGDVLLDPELHAPTSRIYARLRVLPSEPGPIGQRLPVQVHHATAEVPGHVVSLDDDPLGPGETGFVQLVLQRPLAAAVDDRFIVRDTSSSRTIGGGVLLDLRASEDRRRITKHRNVLKALAERDPAKTLGRLLAGPDSWIDLDAFMRDRAIGPKDAAAIVSNLSLVTFSNGSEGGTYAMLPQAWERLRARIWQALDARHGECPNLAGIGLEELRTGDNPPLPPLLFMAVVRKLADAGEVTLDRTWVRRPRQPVRFSPQDEKAWNTVRSRLAIQPYRPPRVRDIAKALGIDEVVVRRLMQMAAMRGDVEEIADDHFFLRVAVQSMAKIIIDIAARSPTGRFTAADIRDRLDNGRKVTTQILEFFDRHGLTVRREDLRSVNPACIKFFAPEAEQRDRGAVPLLAGPPNWCGRQTVSSD